MSQEKETSKVQWFLDVVWSWLPAIIAVLLIRTFVFEPFKIPSGSMIPTLLIGDHVVVTKFSYGIWIPFTGIEAIDLGDPQRGDVIVFRNPRDPAVTYIKRVVAIPGDTIEVRNNRIWLNDVEQTTEDREKYSVTESDCAAQTNRHYRENLSGVEHDILTNDGMGGPLADHAPFKVPDGAVFVMGDNRDNSEDSRAWGTVKFDMIRGKAQRIWFSWDGCTGGMGSVRGDRFLRGLNEPAQ